MRNVGYAVRLLHKTKITARPPKAAIMLIFTATVNNGLSMYLPLEPVDSRGVDFSKVKYIEFDIWLSNGDMFSESKLRRICPSSLDFNNAQLKKRRRRFRKYVGSA